MPLSLQNQTLLPGRNFIGGEWCGAADDRTLSVADPATDEVFAAVPDSGAADARRAVDVAHAAFPSWRKTPAKQRAQIIKRWNDLIVSHVEDLGRLISREQGKPLAEGKGEVLYAASYVEWFAEEATRADGDVIAAPVPGRRMLALREPVGVIAAITPWNFPAAMATRKIGPALAAGCTVVLKPASETPLTALAVADLLTQAGAPAGVVNVICLEPPGPVVRSLLDDGRVRKLSFTGSTEVGRLLLAAAAPTVTSCAMELGGNAPFLVFDDANLDAAVDGAVVAKMRNGGEACTAANRFYVQRGIAPAFTERLATRLGALRVGHGLEPGVELGPLVSEEARAKVARLVDDAVGRGARVVTGGEVPAGAGWFYPPTVLDGVPADAEVLREEIFGPVAPVVVLDDEDDMVRRANDTDYGLISYVYTGDLARGLRVSEALDSGMVGLNRGVVSDPAAPFGGTKQSGLGREGGHEGILEYTETKYVAVTW